MTMRGAFISFMPTFLVPVPNVIVFQYNPETIDHSWTPAAAVDNPDKKAETNPLAVKGLPAEEFSFTLQLDSNDMISDGSAIAEGIAEASGVYTRIAALEMLLYPTGAFGSGLVGSVSVSVGSGGVSVSASTSSASTPVPQMTVPATLFVWGPGRIVPVRISNLRFSERLFDGLLNPTHAEATITLKVMTPTELQNLNGPLSQVCKMAYAYSQGLRQVLATTSLADSAESIIGMLKSIG